MTSMVEKVARAICATHGYRDPYIDTTWHKYIPHARAAIEAMREPTEPMKEAFHNDAIAWFDDEIEDEEHLWKVMIDAALKETP